MLKKLLLIIFFSFTIFLPLAKANAFSESYHEYNISCGTNTGIYNGGGQCQLGGITITVPDDMVSYNNQKYPPWPQPSQSFSANSSQTISWSKLSCAKAFDGREFCPSRVLVEIRNNCAKPAGSIVSSLSISENSRSITLPNTAGCYTLTIYPVFNGISSPTSERPITDFPEGWGPVIRYKTLFFGFKIDPPACTYGPWGPWSSCVNSSKSHTKTANNTPCTGETSVTESEYCCIPTIWTPPPTTVCKNTSFTQTSNCNTTRTVTGTKTTDECCVDTTWTPLPSTQCKDISFTQTSNCSRTRIAVGTLTTGTCCVDTIWTPSPTTKCSGTSFTQTSNCSRTRTAVGTLTTGTCCIPTIWTPPPTTVCKNTSFTQTSNCNTTRTVTGTKTTDECCVDTTWTPLPSTQCKDISFTQTSNCSRTRIAVGTLTTGTCCVDTIWTPSPTTKCSGTSFTQTSNCGTTKVVTGTKTTGTCCIPTTWTPLPTTICSGVTFTQTSDCGTTKTVIGTKTTGTCCTPTTWSPLPMDKCSGETFTQTSNCGTTRTETGAATCVSDTGIRIMGNNGKIIHIGGYPSSAGVVSPVKVMTPGGIIMSIPYVNILSPKASYLFITAKDGSRKALMKACFSEGESLGVVHPSNTNNKCCPGLVVVPPPIGVTGVMGTCEKADVSIY